jgi:hypothetical protein
MFTCIVHLIVGSNVILDEEGDSVKRASTVSHLITPFSMVDLTYE